MGSYNYVLLVIPIVVIVLQSIVRESEGGRLILWDDHDDDDPTVRLALPTETDDSGDDSDDEGTSWAVLVAGSSGFGNYRHQVSACMMMHICVD